MGVRRSVASAIRRRGPRSQKALLRRSLPRRCRAPVDATFGESAVHVSTPTVSPSPQQIITSPLPHVSLRKTSRSNVRKEAVLIYCINIRYLLKYLAELEFHLEAYRPHIVFVQETWLNGSVESVTVQNYRTISRRDRHAGENRGGVLTDSIKLLTFGILSSTRDRGIS